MACGWSDEEITLGDVESLSYAELSSHTLKAVGQLIALHETEVASLRQQLATAKGSCTCASKTASPSGRSSALKCDRPRITFASKPEGDTADMAPAAALPLSPQSDEARSGLAGRVWDLGDYHSPMKSLESSGSRPPWLDTGTLSSLRSQPSNEERRSMLGDTKRLAGIVTILQHLFKGIGFEIVMNTLILLNCVTLGLAVNNALIDASEQSKQAVYITDALLTVIFVLEVILRWVVFPWTFWPANVANLLNLLDAAVTFIPGVLFVFVLSPSGIAFDGSGSEARTMQVIMLFRFLRLARFFRVASHSPWLKSLVVFLRGIAGSPMAFFWGVALLVLVTYAFAILGVVTLSYPIKEMLDRAIDPGEVDTLQSMMPFVGTLPEMMYTLSAVLTGQITATTFLPTMHKHLGWSWLFFHTYLAVMQLLLLNLITATLVDNAIGYHQQEERERREEVQAAEAERQMLDLGALFNLLDENRDGTLTWAEFKKGMKYEEIRTKWKALNYTPEEARACFRFLDRSGLGVPIDDFFEGLKRMTGAAQSRDLLQVLVMVQDLMLVLIELDPRVAARLRKPSSEFVAAGPAFSSPFRRQRSM